MFGKRNWGGCGSLAANAEWARSIRQEMQAIIRTRRRAWKGIISMKGATGALDTHYTVSPGSFLRFELESRTRSIPHLVRKTAGLCSRLSFQEKIAGTTSHQFVSRDCRCVQQRLRGFFSRKRANPKVLRIGVDNLHLLPVVGQFLATVQTHNVGSGSKSCPASRPLFHGERKTITVVPATEEGVKNPPQHLSTSHRNAAPGLGSRDSAPST